MNAWRKVGCCLIAAVCGATSALADVPAVPSVKLATYINGHVSLAIGNAGGTTGIAVQAKTAEEGSWHDVVGFVSNGNGYWSLATNFIGKLQFRFAMVNGEGTGTYCDPIDLEAALALKGTIVKSQDTQWSRGDYAFDGNLASIAEVEWTGLDFGKVVRIRKIRCVFNFSWDGSSRWNGSPFEIADNASFANATTITNVTNIGLGKVYEYVFDTPVETRFVRHRAIQSEHLSSLVALEFLSDTLYERPEISVASDGLDTFNAQCSWTLHPAVAAKSQVLQRARSSEGPWTTLAEHGGGEAFAYLDSGVKTGVQYYYRVQATSGHPDFDGQVLMSDVVPFRPLRRLERETTTSNTLREGVKLLAGYPAASKVFDGSTVTFADASANYVVGVDLGEPAYIAAFAYNCGNGGAANRIQKTLLYGSNSAEDWLADKTVVSGPINKSSSDQTVTFYNVVPGEPAEYQQVFLYGTGWYGNVSELGIFGWSQADIEAAGFPIAPADVRFVRGADGTSVTISWSAGLNVESYRVEMRQEDEWMRLATVAADAGNSHEVTGLVPGNDYFFRIVAVNSADETPTRTWVYCCYEGGDGTGLRGFYRVPVDPASLSPCAEKDVYRESRISRPYIAETSDRLILDETKPDERVAVTWKGTLIVPFAGTYAFAADVKVGDGAMLEVDSHNIVFDLVRRGVGDTADGSVYLSEGEHPISVTYFHGTGVKRFDLTWQSDRVSLETIPVSQLRPAAADADLGLAFGNWTFGTRTENDGFGYAEDRGDGTYRVVYADRRNTISNLDCDEFSWLFRSVRGDFDYCARVSGGSAYKGIMVRTSEGKYLAACHQSGYFFVARLNPSARVQYDSMGTRNGARSGYYKVSRRGNVFSFYTHDDAATDPASEWVLFGETEVSRKDFPREIFVGAFVCVGESQSESGRIWTTAGTVSDIRFKNRNQGMVLMLK